MGQKFDPKNGPKNGPENGRKMGEKWAQNRPKKIDKIEGQKIGFLRHKPKLRLKSKNGPEKSL